MITKTEYGHRFDCANTPGHEEHAHYDDNDTVFLWDIERDGPLSKRTKINGHPMVPVKRTVTYGPWEDA